MNDCKLNNLIDAIGSVSDYAVLEATDGSPQMREHNFMKWVTVAASFVLVCVMGIVAVLLSGGIGQFITPSDNPPGTSAPLTGSSDTDGSIGNDPDDFSVTVLECGKFDAYDVCASQAINSYTLEMSSKMHFPVFKIRSTDELRALTKELWNDPHPHFEAFTDDYFEDNVLFLAFTSPIPFTRNWTAETTVNDGRLTIELFYAYEEGIETPESICVLVSLKKSAASAITFADAIWIFGDDLPTKDEDPVPDNVAYAGYGGSQEFYESSLTGYNPDRPDSPAVFEINSIAELDEFREKAESSGLTVTHRFNNSIPSFNELVREFDDYFFSRNTLYVVYVTDISSSIRYSLRSATVRNSSLTIRLGRTAPELITDDMAGWFVIASVPKSEADMVIAAKVVIVDESLADSVSSLSEHFTSRDSIIAADISAPEEDTDYAIKKWVRAYALSHYPDKEVSDVILLNTERLYQHNMRYADVLFDDGTEVPLVIYLIYDADRYFYLSGIEVRRRVGVSKYSPEYIAYRRADPRTSEWQELPSEIGCGTGMYVYRLDIESILDEISELDAEAVVKTYDLHYSVSPYFKDFDGETLTLCVSPGNVREYTGELAEYHVEYNVKSDSYRIIPMTGGEHFMFHYDENLIPDRQFDLKVNRDNTLVIRKNYEPYDTVDYFSNKMPGSTFDIIYSNDDSINSKYVIICAKKILCIYDIESKSILSVTECSSSGISVKGTRVFYYVYTDEKKESSCLAFIDLSDGTSKEEHRIDPAVTESRYIFIETISADGRYILGDKEYVTYGGAGEGDWDFYAYDVMTGKKISSYLKGLGLPFYNNYSEREYNDGGLWAMFNEGYLFVFEYAV